VSDNTAMKSGCRAAIVSIDTWAEGVRMS